MRISCDDDNIDVILEHIKRGKVIIFPTDTVYGIGCDPYIKSAVQRIYDIKNRESQKALPILGYSKQELEAIVEFDEISSRLIKKFWPGPLTIILKLKDDRIKDSMGIQDEVAVRVPKNTCIQKILKGCKLLVGTSANISGKKPHTNPDECIKNITGYDLFVDGGNISSSAESTIIKIQDKKPIIIREGAISKGEICDLF